MTRPNCMLGTSHPLSQEETLLLHENTEKSNAGGTTREINGFTKFDSLNFT